jgi:hypothetical protein
METTTSLIHDTDRQPSTLYGTPMGSWQTASIPTPDVVLKGISRWKVTGLAAGMLTLITVCMPGFEALAHHTASVSIRLNGVTPLKNTDSGAAGCSDVYVKAIVTPDTGNLVTATTPAQNNACPGTKIFEDYPLLTNASIGPGPLQLQWMVYDSDGLIPQQMSTATRTGIACDNQEHHYNVNIWGSPTTAAASSVTIRCVPRLHVPIDFSNNWALRLKTLKVKQWNEGTWDDEPYFVVIGFRSRFNTPGSTQLYWSHYLDDYDDDVLGDPLEDSTVATIPRYMGKVVFHNVEPIFSISQVLSGAVMPELIGAIAIAIESDVTSFGTISDMMDTLVAQLRQELVKLVEQATVPPTEDQLQQAVANVKEAMMDSGDFGDWLASLGDIDDFVDHHLFLFLSSLDPRVGNVLQPISGATTGLLQEQPASFKVNFARSDTSYDVTVVLVPGPASGSGIGKQ